MKMKRQKIGVMLLTFLLLFSCKPAKLSDAVKHEERGEYYAAADIYRKVFSKTKSSKKILRGTLAFHVGECYRLSNQTSRALTGYSNALRYDYPDSTALLYHARMLHKMGRYGDARKQYEAFLELDPNNILARNGLIGCDSAPEWKKLPSRYTVKKMDKFNTRDGQFAPMLYGSDYDQLYFSSSRKDAMGEEKSGITGTKNNDFYLVKQDEKKEWMKPERVESGVNTEFDEGVCSFSTDGSEMYYTYCPENPDGPNTAEIRLSSRSGAAWGAGERLEIFRDTLTMAAHPAVGADGYLYFVSDAAGGYGGKDLWRIPLATIGASYPENLGPEINTPGDELFPYMREDGTLFFSSDGHPGMGGLDIFKAQKDSTDYWTIENLKAPFNSQADDFGITFAGRREQGFFSSNRNDTRGADYLYSFALPGVWLYLEGWVLNRDEELIPNARVRVVGKDGTNQQIFVRDDGTYFMEVSPGMDYVMMASAPEHLNQKQYLSVPPMDKSETFYVDFYLHSIHKPELIENIFYDFDRATLRPESKESLDQLITLLEDNPHVTIELRSHTDRKGSDEYNIGLSQRRAQSVVDYLIRGGIAKDRLTAKGYGESVPQTVSRKAAEQFDFLPEGQVLDETFIETLTPEQQEAADQLNRRTEFQVLSVTYGLM